MRSLARPGQWPLPLKVLAFVVAFAAFKPLGVAVLIYFIVQARKRRHFARRAFVGNSAFAEHRRQTLDTLADEERAFAEFPRERFRDHRDQVRPAERGERQSPRAGMADVGPVERDGVPWTAQRERGPRRQPEVGVHDVQVRGAEALDLLKAWGTGHPGGIGTIHAGSALGALRRLEQLVQEAVVTVPRALIAETINVIGVLAGRGASRRLTELAVVQGLSPAGDYILASAVDLISAEDHP